ncbi:sigma-70 family RNA polymerase sigma factor [Chitinophaga sp. 212800010-3]|uniref:RNA polymerase sigma factor n=1 Tax=unclassified Chitinophaga TaxID=2619133 RepID=UPI002E107CCC
MGDNKIHIDHPDLLARIAESNELAIEVFFHSFYPRLKYYCLDILKDQGEAEDIAQDAITIFWRQRQRFKQASLKEASAFVFTVARNRCYDYLKHLQVRSSQRKSLEGKEETIEDILESRIIKDDLFYRIYLEILRLSPSQAQILKMIFIQGLQTHEIAEQLGLTSNNVRNQKARALDKLRTRLQKRRFMLSFLLAFFLVPCDAFRISVVSFNRIQLICTYRSRDSGVRYCYYHCSIGVWHLYR